MRLLERAGAAAIQLEDQVFPKRCGHFEGKEFVSSEEMVSKIRAAADSRRDPNLLIVARTDARATEGLDSAIDRGLAYRDAGADVIFVEAPTTIEELREVGRRVPGPKLANMVEGGATPILGAAEFGELGFAIVLYANAALRSAQKAVSATPSSCCAKGPPAGCSTAWPPGRSARRPWARPSTTSSSGGTRREQAFDLRLAGGTVVLPGEGARAADVLVSDGRIAGVIEPGGRRRRGRPSTAAAGTCCPASSTRTCTWARTSAPRRRARTWTPRRRRPPRAASPRCSST